MCTNSINITSPSLYYSAVLCIYLTVSKDRASATHRVLHETVELTGTKRALCITEIQSCDTPPTTV